jgi:hypothetical protein
MNFRALLLLILLLPVRSMCQQFEAEGTIVYSIGNEGATYQEARHFLISRSNSQWKIKTIPLSRGTSQESLVLFDEAGCDGTNIFYLNQSDTNKAYLSGSPNEVKEKNFAPGVGRVQNVNHPPCLELNLIYPVWMAFCSSPYLSGLGDGKVVTPLFDVHDFFTGPIPKEWDLPAKWKLNDSSFVSEMSWLSEGKYVNSDKNGTQTIGEYPPPFNGGFQQARFVNGDWTNCEGMLLPKSFLLEVYSPDYKSDGKTNVNLFYSIAGTVDVIRSLNNFSCMPNLTTETVITDSRVYLGSLPISYNSTSNWDTVAEIRTKLHNKRLGLSPSLKSYESKRPIIILVMVGITALFMGGAAMLRRVSKQNTNK